MSGAVLAASIPVPPGESTLAVRALEDAAIAAQAPALVDRLHAIDREHDRAMARLREQYRSRENRYDDEWPDPPRDIWGLDALALVIVAVGLAVVVASARYGDRWDAPAAAVLCAGLIVVATVLHLVQAVRSRPSTGLSNHRASSVVGCDALFALVGACLIVWRADRPSGGSPLEEVLVPVIVVAVCGAALVVVWVAVRRRGAPERAVLARYRAAEASWREDLDPRAAELAARSSAAAQAALLELDPEARVAIEGDLAEAARILRRRDDVFRDVVAALDSAPFGAHRYDDRV